MGTADTDSDASGSVLLVVGHSGVKGMRWGVRKGASSGTSTSSGSHDPRSEDSAKVKTHLETIDKHGTKALSNKDLQEVVSRMNLVQQYSNLATPSGKSSVDKGHEAVKKALAIHTTLTNVHKAYNSPGAKAVRTGLKTARFARKTTTKAGEHAVKFAFKQITK